MDFAESLIKFDNDYVKKSTLDKSYVPVHGKFKTDLKLKNKSGEFLEEYYKWQFIYALTQSGLHYKDYIGVEVFFPKGSSGSKPIKFDCAIFSDKNWVTHYNNFWENKDEQSLDLLRESLIVVGEFKRNNVSVEKVFREQLKPAMKEKEPLTENVLGFIYDNGRLHIFQRKKGKFIRFDESKNQKGDVSGIADLSLQIPDPYILLPDFEHTKNLGKKTHKIDRSKRDIYQLDMVTTIASVHIQNALSNILRQLDKVGLVNQRGYKIILHTIALKIYDESQNERNPTKKLKFYITDNEKSYSKLSDTPISDFITRMKSIETKAKKDYRKIIIEETINWKNENSIKAVISICESFQDYSFIRSSSTDLYQLVFYNFANTFTRDEAAQFLTPLPVIKFLVSLINPRGTDTVCDPCMGIGDFLVMAYLNSKCEGNTSLADTNLYGVDLDEVMLSLATLNLLLAGDGNARLFHKPGYGSINSKIGIASGEDAAKLIELIPDEHKSGNWDDWQDETELHKFDVILTNPPFGEDRAFRPQTPEDMSVIQLYETWDLAGSSDALDLGVVFLENAYRSLNENGRLGIVISNSLASVQKWNSVRSWFSSKMRIVGIFDLPSNVFAETGVNTSILVAYKPSETRLVKLQNDGYEIFCRDITKVGYEKRTRKRNVYFNPTYKLDPISFDIEVDPLGEAILDEEFSDVVSSFKDWVLTQEEDLQQVFIE